MKISRYYTDEKLELGEHVVKDIDLIHRLNNVLKYKAGEQIKLFNGLDGLDYLSFMKEINKKECTVNVVEVIKNENKIDKKINTCVAVVKSDFDEMVREMVELGVNEINPLISDRVERKEINYERLNKIILEACEQSGRGTIPKLNKIIKLSDFSNFSSQNVCYHTEVVSQNNLVAQGVSENNENRLASTEVVNIFIGPEGGWTENEIDWFKGHNFVIRNLRTNILRAKTAAAICTYDAIASC